MRIETPVNRETVGVHLNYNLWKYLLILAAALLGWSILYTMTTYRPPQEKRIDLYVQSYTSSTEIVDAFLEPIWKEAVPEMESVRSVILTPLDEISTDQQLTTYTMAADMDIVLFSDMYFKKFAARGFFLPLDDLVANGVIDPGGADLTSGYVTMVEEYDDQDRPVKTAWHLYGIPLESFDGFISGMNMDNRDMYAAIMTNNYNDENVIPFFNALLQAGREDLESLMQQTDANTTE